MKEETHEAYITFEEKLRVIQAEYRRDVKKLTEAHETEAQTVMDEVFKDAVAYGKGRMKVSHIDIRDTILHGGENKLANGEKLEVSSVPIEKAMKDMDYSKLEERVMNHIKADSMGEIDELKEAMKSPGHIEMIPPKFTKGKPKFELIFPEAMLELAKIRTAGAETHSPNSWQKIGMGDLIGACHRHLNKIERGMKVDDGSSFFHAAHLMCQAMFIFQNHFNAVQPLRTTHEGRTARNADSDMTFNGRRGEVL